jgi:predicted small secreted protein
MKSLLTLLVVVLLSGCATAKGMRTDISDGLEKVSEMIRPDAQPVRKPNER